MNNIPSSKDFIGKDKINTISDFSFLNLIFFCSNNSFNSGIKSSIFSNNLKYLLCFSKSLKENFDSNE